MEIQAPNCGRRICESVTEHPELLEDLCPRQLD
jgi:hypothetical protein